MKHVSFKLGEHQHLGIELLSRRLGLNKSNTIRTLLNEGLEKNLTDDEIQQRDEIVRNFNKILSEDETNWNIHLSKMSIIERSRWERICSEAVELSKQNVPIETIEHIDGWNDLKPIEKSKIYDTIHFLKNSGEKNENKK